MAKNIAKLEVLSEDGEYNKGPLLTEQALQKFNKLILLTSGISLDSSKSEFLRIRLSARIKERGFSSFGDYYNFIEKDKSNNELTYLINAVSTNKTGFFREKHHFDFLERDYLPKLIQEKRKKFDRKIRIWCAGCSTGQEPYTVAISLLRVLKITVGWDLKILATDIDSNVLQFAKKGVYKYDENLNIPNNELAKYFKKGSGGASDFVMTKDKLKKLIFFKKLNLITREFPIHTLFDIILCRNVMIYFEKQTRINIYNNFYNHLLDEGLLFIGSSESLHDMDDKFDYLVPTIYKKK